MDCEREPPSLMRIVGPSLEMRRSRITSSKADDAPMSKRSSTRVLLRLACWPPGPPDVSNRHSSSDSGMSNRGLLAMAIADLQA